MATKSPRVSRSSTAVTDRDRISHLPDAILCHVLSYLPTKTSVSTRVLSKRWNHLYTLVPILYFFNLSWDDTSRFLNFVDSVISSYDVEIMDTFFFSSSGFLTNGPQFLSWASEPVRRKARVLHLSAHFIERIDLPREIFTCETITSLDLLGNFNLEIPENVCLPNVKIIRLLGLLFRDGCSARRLFRACHVLEELFLNNCCMKNVEVLEISVPSLKTLKINGYEDKYELVLDVPNVEVFEYHGNESRGFTCKGRRLDSLVDANIWFNPFTYPGYGSLPRLFNMISCVRYLYLSYYTMEAFERSFQSLPTFPSLTHLEIGHFSFSPLNLGLLIELLEGSPCLEEIVFDKGSCSQDEKGDIEEYSYLLPEGVPDCVSLHLKVVEYKGFSMLGFECMLVEYLLQKAKKLEDLIIETKSSRRKQFEMSKKLLAFPRCSKTCQIEFVSGGEGKR